MKDNPTDSLIVYQGELAHPDIRGRVTALQQFMLGIGALAAAWISYGMHPPGVLRRD